MRRTLIALVVGVFLVAACASAASPAAAPEEKPAGGEGVAAPVPAATGLTSDQVANDAEQRLIVRVGELELQVNDVSAAYQQARQLALRLGGYVGDSQFATDASGRPSATVVLRIPADRYEEALAALRPLAAKVVVERSQESDVTSQVVDLNARIVNLRATEAALQKLMDKATKVSDVLAVQQELTGVREQIEQLTAQQQLLQKQAALATLTVTLETVPQPVTEVTKSWDPGADIQRALAQLVDVGQSLGRLLIWLVIVVLPISIAAAIVVGLAWLLVRRTGIRRPAFGGMAGGGSGGPAQQGPPAPPPPVDFGGSA